MKGSVVHRLANVEIFQVFWCHIQMPKPKICFCLEETKSKECGSKADTFAAFQCQNIANAFMQFIESTGINLLFLVISRITNCLLGRVCCRGIKMVIDINYTVLKTYYIKITLKFPFTTRFFFWDELLEGVTSSSKLTYLEVFDGMKLIKRLLTEGLQGRMGVSSPLWLYFHSPKSHQMFPSCFLIMQFTFTILSTVCVMIKTYWVQISVMNYL